MSSSSSCGRKGDREVRKDARALYKLTESFSAIHETGWRPLVRCLTIVQGSLDLYISISGFGPWREMALVLVGLSGEQIWKSQVGITNMLAHGHYVEG